MSESRKVILNLPDRAVQALDRATALTGDTETGEGSRTPPLASCARSSRLPGHPGARVS
jgi:hypothetical protein